MRADVRSVVLSLLLLFAFAASGGYASQLPGWPRSTGGEVWSSPALADLNGDGRPEVVVGSNDSMVYVWQADGTLLPGWPRATGDRATSSPAVGDIDGDGDPEVVTGSEDFSVYAWDADGTPVAGWPKATGDQIWSSPALGELDEDGKPEIAIASGDHALYIWHGDGTPLTHWPQDTGAWENSSPALVDLGGDGRLEIVLASFSDWVWAWFADGTTLSSWPRTMAGGADGSTAIGELDADGYPEIVSCSDSGYVYVWHTSGNLMTGWPVSLGTAVWASPALGDLDADGHLEVVVEVCYEAPDFYSQVYALRADGTVMEGWPQQTSVGGYVNGSLALGDIDGDDKPEVVAGSYGGSVFAWNDDGTLVPGWPQFASDGVGSSPALGDLDGDGRLEVVAGSYDHKVYAWKCDTTTDDLAPWSAFLHSAQRDSRYQPPAPVVDFSGTPAVGFPPLNVQFLDLSVHLPTSWQWSFGDGGTATVRNPFHSFAKVGTYPVSLTVTNGAGSASLTKPHYILVTFTDVPFEPEHWALHQILACVDADIVQGFSATTYAPALSVTRDQMAVYIARALSGGDANVPTGPATATFEDVPNTGYGDSGTEPYWAYRYIEYCVAHGVVRGYDATHYSPSTVVTRDQMAVFVARAKGWVGIDDNMTTAPEVFSDVPAGFWAGTAIQACADHSVVQGYSGNLYHPEWEVTRDQMAVYIQRAFALPM